MQASVRTTLSFKRQIIYLDSIFLRSATLIVVTCMYWYTTSPLNAAPHEHGSIEVLTTIAQYVE